MAFSAANCIVKPVSGVWCETRFNSHARGGRDLKGSRRIMGRKCFNSRARGRARPESCRSSWVVPPSFNSRARGRARQVYTVLSSTFLKFQLTRPWEGATYARGLFSLLRLCFNSRARGRARLITPMGRPKPRMFQLTRPWEGATPTYCFPEGTVVVSTHAPVGGRDFRRGTRPGVGLRFNSRARGRARLLC